MARSSRANPPLAHLERPLAPGRPVLVLHSWWGLTASFTDFSRRLARRGLLAGCVDLYDGAVARTAAEAKALRSAPRSEPMYRTMLRGLDQLRADPGSDGSDPGIVGFSMGGHWAMWLAQRQEVGAAAVVLYYATRAVTAGSPVPVLAHFADVDPFVSVSGRRRMESELARRSWPYQAYDYPATEHWFAESADDHYDRVASEIALRRTAAFLTAPAGQ